MIGYELRPVMIDLSMMGELVASGASTGQVTKIDMAGIYDTVLDMVGKGELPVLKVKLASGGVSFVYCNATGATVDSDDAVIFTGNTCISVNEDDEVEIYATSPLQ